MASRAGNAWLDNYREFMQEWESQLNHYLLTGTMLADGAGPARALGTAPDGVEL